MGKFLAFCVAFYLLLFSGQSFAQDTACYKQPIFGSERAKTRKCRFNQLFESWLNRQNINTDEFLSTYELVDKIGSTVLGEDNALFGDPRGFLPKATIGIGYVLTKEETLKVVEKLKIEPGYFNGLVTTLERGAHRIICETPDGFEEDFALSGGLMNYEINLRPGVIWSGVRRGLNRTLVIRPTYPATASPSDSVDPARTPFVSGALRGRIGSVSIRWCTAGFPPV